MGVFDEILKAVKEEDRTVIAKYPQLQQAVADLEKTKEELSGFVGQWETWRADHWDTQLSATKTEVAARQELSAAQERVRALEAAGVSDMSFDEILQNLKTQGFATKSDAEAAAKSTVEQAIKHDGPAGLVQRGDFNQGLFNQENAYFDSATLPLKHDKEFNEILDLRQVFKYAVDNKLPNVQDAYDRMVAPRRAEAKAVADKAAQEATELKIKEAEERGEQRAKQAMAMSPTDLGGQEFGIGPMAAQRLADRQPPPDLPEAVKTAKLGDMTTARTVLEQYMKDRATSVQ